MRDSCLPGSVLLPTVIRVACKIKGHKTELRLIEFQLHRTVVNRDR